MPLIVRLASYPSHANIYTKLYLITPKSGRSGRFGDVMMMSIGCGLEECLECEWVQAFPTFLGSRQCQMTLKTLKWKRSVVCMFQKLAYLPFFCVDCLQKVPGFMGPIETTQTIMKTSLLVPVPGFTYFQSLLRQLESAVLSTFQTFLTWTNHIDFTVANSLDHLLYII